MLVKDEAASLAIAAESIMATSVEKRGIIPHLQRLEHVQSYDVGGKNNRFASQHISSTSFRAAGHSGPTVASEESYRQTFKKILRKSVKMRFQAYIL